MQITLYATKSEEAIWNEVQDICQSTSITLSSLCLYLLKQWLQTVQRCPNCGAALVKGWRTVCPFCELSSVENTKPNTKI